MRGGGGGAATTATIPRPASGYAHPLIWPAPPCGASASWARTWPASSPRCPGSAPPPPATASCPGRGRSWPARTHGSAEASGRAAEAASKGHGNRNKGDSTPCISNVVLRHSKDEKPETDDPWNDPWPLACRAGTTPRLRQQEPPG